MIELKEYVNEKESACELIAGFWKEHSQIDMDQEDIQSEFEEWILKGKFYFIVFDGMKVGFVHLASRGNEIDWLEHIYVKSFYQKRGFGSEAIRLCEEIVKQYSDSLYIEAAARNQQAIHLYQKLGYNCLNTITIRKDFHQESFETIGHEKICHADFEVRKRKTN